MSEPVPGDPCAAALRWLDAMPLVDDPGWRASPAGDAPAWQRWLVDARTVDGLDAALVALLRGHSDPVRRSAAALALGWVGLRPPGGEAAHAALLAALAGDVALVAAEAAAALGRWSCAGDVPALCRALANAEADVRASACTALAQLGGSAARDALRATADDDAEHFVRTAANEALRRLQSGTAGAADR